MLYKNGVKHDLTAAEKKEVGKYLTKDGKLILEFAQERYLANPTKVLSPAGKYMSRAQVSEPPPSFPIPNRSVVVSADGDSSEWIYAENIIAGPNGSKRYLPKVIQMKNALIVSDIEKAFFIAVCSPFVGNGPGGERERKKNANYHPWLMIVKPEEDAQTMLDNEEVMDSAKSLIRKELGLEELREVALSYNLAKATDMSEPILRRAMLERIVYDNSATDPYHNYKTFMDRVKKPDDVKINSAIQRLIDVKAIKFDTKGNSWVTVKSDGNSGQTLLKLRQNQAANAQENLIKTADKDNKLKKKIIELAELNTETDTSGE